MDVKLLLVLLAAYICGSYKNQRSLPAPFQGNLAVALDGYTRSMKHVRPYYLEQYGHIGGQPMTDISNQDEGNSVMHNQSWIM